MSCTDPNSSAVIQHTHLLVGIEYTVNIWDMATHSIKRGHCCLMALACHTQWKLANVFAVGRLCSIVWAEVEFVGGRTSAVLSVLFQISLFSLLARCHSRGSKRPGGFFLPQIKQFIVPSQMIVCVALLV